MPPITAPPIPAIIAPTGPATCIPNAAPLANPVPAPPIPPLIAATVVLSLYFSPIIAGSFSPSIDIPAPRTPIGPPRASILPPIKLPAAPNLLVSLSVNPTPAKVLAAPMVLSPVLVLLNFSNKSGILSANGPKASPASLWINLALRISSCFSFTVKLPFTSFVSNPNPVCSTVRAASSATAARPAAAASASV